MKIKNLTNSPYDLVNSKGEKVRLPARGSVEIDPHAMHAQAYRLCGYFDVSESVEVDKVESVDQSNADVVVDAEPEEHYIATEQEQSSDDTQSPADEYFALTGKRPDGRWSAERLADELNKLKA